MQAAAAMQTAPCQRKSKSKGSKRTEWVRSYAGRAHRHGQKLPVNVYFLCAKGTADDRRRVLSQDSAPVWCPLLRPAAQLQPQYNQGNLGVRLT